MLRLPMQSNLKGMVGEMNWILVVACLEIFFCRILDVSLGTVRMLLTVKGKTLPAALLGFVEVFIWFIVVRDALTNSGEGVFIAIAYAAGYAVGTYIGGKFSNRFIKGHMTVNIVLSQKDDELVAVLREAGFGATVINVNGSSDCDANPKYMLICEIMSSRLEELKKIVKGKDPDAFFMVQEAKLVLGGFVK